MVGPKYHDPFEARRQRLHRDEELRVQRRHQALNLRRFSPLYNMRAAGMMAQKLRDVGPHQELWYAGLTPHQAAAIYVSQPAHSNWCWAACLSMLFRHSGLTLSAPAIVQIVLGAVEDRRIGPDLLQQHMTRLWMDDQEKIFQARLEVYRNQVPILQTPLELKILENMQAGRLHFISEEMYHITLLRGMEVILDTRSGAIGVQTIILLDPGRGPEVRVDGQHDGAMKYIAGVEITPAAL